ncbi:hypothetical protein B7486_53355, partial [cyanobacterium TDX16]
MSGPGPSELRPGGVGRGGVGPVVTPAVVLGGLGAVFLATDRPVAAGVALTASVVVVQAVALVPAVARGVARIVEPFARAVGLALAVLLLVPAYLLLMTPGAIVSRLTGSSPLPTGGRWSPTPRPMSHRPYADDRTTLGGHDGAGTATVGRVVLVVLAVEALLVGGFVVVDRWRDDDGPAPAGVAFVEAVDAPALAGEDWVPAAAAEQSALEHL